MGVEFFNQFMHFLCPFTLIAIIFPSIYSSSILFPGLQRCGKSCRLRWTNYLRPDLKHGQFSEAEEQTIVTLHSVLLVLNSWSVIASQLPGRTDNDVKNHWNTKLKKKLSGMGIDPVTHKPFSHLISEIATLPPPQAPNLAEAALGCFKDEMLHLLTKRRIDLQLHQKFPANTNTTHQENKDQKIKNINFGLSKAIEDPETMTSNDYQNNHQAGAGGFNSLPGSESGYHYQLGSLSNDADFSPWSQSMSTYTQGDDQGCLPDKLYDEHGESSEGTKEGRNNRSNIYNSGYHMWDLPSNDLINPIV